jgi:hypothetical protein
MSSHLSKQLSLGGDELLREAGAVAEIPQREFPKIVHSTPRNVSSPHERECAPRLRRERRLTPELPPITPADYF